MLQLTSAMEIGMKSDKKRIAEFRKPVAVSTGRERGRICLENGVFKFRFLGIGTDNTVRGMLELGQAPEDWPKDAMPV
ncbi:MAG: hypothetical protein DU429_07505 [Candidatus Tokpelaia sp.]|nr:MAG: hypothetical protein DU429_07505 [Candidatus Tokpelaia sp.]